MAILKINVTDAAGAALGLGGSGQASSAGMRLKARFDCLLMHRISLFPNQYGRKQLFK